MIGPLMRLLRLQSKLNLITLLFYIDFFFFWALFIDNRIVIFCDMLLFRACFEFTVNYDLLDD